MLVTFQNRLHETTGHTIYTRATLHFRCIFLCSSRTFDQSHSLMEADCAHKLPGRPLCGTTECETGLFRQQARKTPFYKHYLHYKFLKLSELLMFLEFLVTFRILRLCHDFVFGQVKARNTIILFAYSAKSIAPLITHFFDFTC